MCSPISYTWVTTNTVIGVGTSSIQFGLCPGNYTVAASGAGSGSCCPSAVTTFTIGSNTTCSLNANFNKTYLPNGVVNFVSTSTGTYAGSVYIWEFGDGPPVTTLAVTSHTYASQGPYLARLTVVNSYSTGCLDSTVTTLINPIYCNLNASFTYTPPNNGVCNFSNTSTGITGSSIFSWNFGDGSPAATGTVVSHTYSIASSYFVILTVSNSSTCIDTAGLILPVPVVCPITAAFTHTVGSGGAVAFSSSSTGTNSTSQYLWDFGDGYTGITTAPTHVYSNSGNHYVKLRVTDLSGQCRDSIIQSLNITGIPCVANSGFTLVPSGTPQFWYAIPSYPYNVTAATWNWGDGSTSNTLYASHVYSVSATYSICLSVTVSCGANSTYCSSYLIAKPSGTPTAGGIYSVNVQPPPMHVGLESLEVAESGFFIYPNPAEGKFYIRTTEAMIRHKYYVSDLLGKVVAIFEVTDQEQELDLGHLQAGIYLINGNAIKPVKVVIAR
jgi:PKD repeat protein